jgi:hypothetical protein
MQQLKLSSCDKGKLMPIKLGINDGDAWNVLIHKIRYEITTYILKCSEVNYQLREQNSAKPQRRKKSNCYYLRLND